MYLIYKSLSERVEAARIGGITHNLSPLQKRAN
jgi:hypothetical protein